jgi:GxxExxY protein
MAPEANYRHGALTKQIVGSAIEVHRVLGPGLLESVYEECLCYEFAQRGLGFQRQVPLPLMYKDVRLATELVIDVVVEVCVLLELKSVAETLPIHQAQLMTYLKLSGIGVGLLINFNVPILARGVIRRVI